MFAVSRLLAFSLLVAIGVFAETHTVNFLNNCGIGTPQLVQDGNVLSTGAPFIVGGPLIGAIGFLQTGRCGPNGENCTVVETTLQNSGSDTVILDTPPYAFSGPIGFAYINGCDGEGEDCTSAGCPNPFLNLPNDPVLHITCQDQNVGLEITFCD